MSNTELYLNSTGNNWRWHAATASATNLRSTFMESKAKLRDAAPAVLIASVTESKDFIFSSGKMPLPPVFEFKSKQGRIDWRLLMNTDIDRVIRETNVGQIEQLLSNITFAELDF
jgi:hypothetical protein